MHCYTRPTQIRGRCILGGKGRGIFRDFKMSRVCVGCPGKGLWIGLLTLLVQYNFRMQALEGNLAGVKKASW